MDQKVNFGEHMLKALFRRWAERWAERHFPQAAAGGGGSAGSSRQGSEQQEQPSPGGESEAGTPDAGRCAGATPGYNAGRARHCTHRVLPCYLCCSASGLLGVTSPSKWWHYCLAPLHQASKAPLCPPALRSGDGDALPPSPALPALPAFRLTAPVPPVVMVSGGDAVPLRKSMLDFDGSEAEGKEIPQVRVPGSGWCRRCGCKCEERA